MPTLRDRSKLLNKSRLSDATPVEVEPRKSRWSIKEKRIFLKALESYKPEETVMIRRVYFPKKSLRDVDNFIAERLAQAEELCKIKQDSEKELPPVSNLKDWLKKTDRLVGESSDYSFCMGQAIENFLIKNQFAQTTSHTEVRWSLMYEYLMCLLNDQPLPDLGQLEAGTFLILLEELVVRLHTSDIADIQKLLSMKHQLLTKACESTNTETSSNIIKKALNLDILKVHQAKPAEKANGGSQEVVGCQQTTTLQAPSATELSTISNHIPATSHIPTANNTTTCNTSITASTSIPTTNYPMTTNTPASNAATSHVFVTKATDKQLEPLFSINPLCIPISLLNPSSKKLK